MNEQNNLNPNTNPAQFEQVSPMQQPKTTTGNYLFRIKNGLHLALEKIKQTKFYKNKMIFWPITISAGLILLIIITGLLFGKRNNTSKVLSTPTPIPTVEPTPQATTSGVLGDSYKKLLDLKSQITNFDVKQSYLTPPDIDFNLRFDTP